MPIKEEMKDVTKRKACALSEVRTITKSLLPEMFWSFHIKSNLMKTLKHPRLPPLYSNTVMQSLVMKSQCKNTQLPMNALKHLSLPQRLQLKNLKKNQKKKNLKRKSLKSLKKKMKKNVELSNHTHGTPEQQERLGSQFLKIPKSGK